MSTKLTELRDGCFAKAMDDEPMFVLLARDPQAPALVRSWAARRKLDIGMGRRPAADMAQVDDAERTAADMDAWRVENDGAWRGGLFANNAPVTRGALYTGSNLSRDATIPVIARDDRDVMLPQGHALLADINCKAVQYHDYKVCRSCGIEWPVDDARPAECRAASISGNVNAVVIPSLAAIERARDGKPPSVAFDFTDIQQAPSHHVERQGDEYFCACGMRWATDESDPHE